MKKIWLFVLPWDINSLGGVNQVVINLINSFEKQSINTQLLIDQNSEALNNKNIGNTPIKFISLANPCWSPGLLGIVKYLLKLPFLLFILHKKISADVQCINPHYPSLNVINYIFLKLFNLYSGKIILSFHGSDLISIKKSTKLEKSLWHFIFRHIDFMVCCSQKLADELQEYINDPIIDYKIKVIHNGIDKQIMDKEHGNLNKLPQELQGSRFILNVATFEHKKGQDVLIRAFSAFKAIKDPIKLVLIGRSNNALKEYRTLASKLGCEDNIIFIENMGHDEVLQFFREAEVFCLPSRYEPFGIVLLEAGYYSCPVVASNVGGIPEIIENGFDGYLVEAGNVDQLANCLSDILNNKQLAQETGGRLKNKVIGKFTWNIAAAKYLNLVS